LLFWPFFEKNLTNAPLLERFQKMDPDLGAMDCSAELTVTAPWISALRCYNS
jgi:hypothetical protein